MRRFTGPTSYCRARATLIPPDAGRVAPGDRLPGGRPSEAYAAAITAGWRECQVVDRYLEHVRIERTRLTVRPTVQMIERRLTEIGREVKRIDGFLVFGTISKHGELSAQIRSLAEALDRLSTEDDFVAVAASFGRRHGIDYATWREFGVAHSVLARASIHQ